MDAYVRRQLNLWPRARFDGPFSYPDSRIRSMKRMKIMLRMNICIFHVCKLVFFACKINMRHCLQHTIHSCSQVSV